ncbi:MAG: NADP-dependent oxidoreductase [Waddliaceae bacterium]
MKAIVFKDFGAVDNLELKEVSIPNPTENQVQIRVQYAGVNPVDWKIGSGMLKEMLKKMGIQWEFPLIPGWDASGVIEKVGRNVKNFKEGDEVYTYCRKPKVQWGTYAEYVNADSNDVALKPRDLSFAEAAAIPLVGLTAWQALYDVGHIQKDQTVCIHAGAGGVGSLAISLAKNAGAKIFTTASTPHHEYVKDLGADYAIDYSHCSFAQQIKTHCPEGVDLCLDAVGGETLEKSFEIVKPGGRLISIVQPVSATKAKEYGIVPGFVFVRPNGEQLTQITDLFNQGKIRSPHIEEMPLSQAKEAIEKSQTGHTCGKIVLKVR